MDLYKLENVAYDFNQHVRKKLPKHLKHDCDTGGGGDSETALWVAELVHQYDISIDPKLYVDWREHQPIVYGSTWAGYHCAIEALETIDARPEVQAEFKRRGITPSVKHLT